MRKILVHHNGHPLGSQLSEKLATLPDVALVSRRQRHSDLDVAIICPVGTSAVGYRLNQMAIMDQVQVKPETHLITLGSVCEYSEQVALPYIPELLWEGYPDGEYRGVLLRTLEVAVRAHREAGGVGHHIVLDSMFGPEDDFGDDASFIPAMIYRMTKALQERQETVTVNSDGKAERTFLHYQDAIDGIIAVLNNGEHYQGVINHGGSQKISIDKLAEIIKNFVGFPGEIVYDASRPGGRAASIMHCSLLHDGIGFRPQKRLIAGIEETVKAYREKLASLEA